jgi:hypothetical protein
LEKSINKVIYSAISQLELPLAEKLAFLQINDPEAKIAALIGHLANKTESLKGINEL